MSVSTVNKTGENISKVCGEIANSTDTLKKASSVTMDTLAIAMEVMGFFPGTQGVKAAFGMLFGQLKMTKTIINATSLIGMGYEWGDPERLKANTKTWQQTAKQVTLTAALVMETTGFIDNLTYRYFSQPALSIGGKIPIFDVIKNSLFAISSGFGIWTASMDMKYAGQVIRESKFKTRKWEARRMELGDATQFDYQKVQTKYQKRLANLEQLANKADYAQKIELYKEYTGLLNADAGAPQDQITESIKNFQHKKIDRLISKFGEKAMEVLNKSGFDPQNDVQKIETEMNKMKTAIEEKQKKIPDLKTQWDGEKDKAKKKTLAEEIKKEVKELVSLRENLAKCEKYGLYCSEIKNDPNTVQLKARKFVDFKLEKLATKIHNGKNLHTKSWISIVAEVGKLFMIIVGTIVLALSYIFPVLHTVAVNITMTSCGLVSDSFGLAKNLYRDVFYKANEKKMPSFPPLQPKLVAV